jgi:hypothetical protein
MAPLPHSDTVCFSLTYVLLASTWGSLPPTARFSPPRCPPPPPTNWLWLFLSQTFSHKNTTISSWLFVLLTLPMQISQTQYSKTLAYKIQMLGNHPKEIIQQSEHGQILKSKTHYNFFCQGANWLQQGQCKATTYLNHAIISGDLNPLCVVYVFCHTQHIDKFTSLHFWSFN